MNPEEIKIPQAPQIPTIPAEDGELERKSVIRTYEGDVAKAIEKKRASVMTIAIAENVAKSRGQTISNAPQKHYGKQIFYFLLSLILLGVAVGGLYFIYLQSPLAPVKIAPITDNKFPTIIKPDIQKVVDITGKNSSAVISIFTQAINNNVTAPDATLGSINELVFTKKIDGSVKRVGGPEMLSLLGFSPPDVLTRSLTLPWMFGMYETDNTVPFIIITTDFYQNAYTGMLKWEENIVDDMKQLFDYPPAPFEIAIESPSVASTTMATSKSTTTVEEKPKFTQKSIASLFNINGRFEDTIIQNRDVRRFRDQYGRILLLYVFLDKNTILISNKESIIGETLRRIEKAVYVR